MENAKKKNKNQREKVFLHYLSEKPWSEKKLKEKSGISPTFLFDLPAFYNFHRHFFDDSKMRKNTWKNPATTTLKTSKSRNFSFSPLFFLLERKMIKMLKEKKNKFAVIKDLKITETCSTISLNSGLTISQDIWRKRSFSFYFIQLSTSYLEKFVVLSSLFSSFFRFDFKSFEILKSLITNNNFIITFLFRFSFLNERKSRKITKNWKRSWQNVIMYFCWNQIHENCVD